MFGRTHTHGLSRIGPKWGHSRLVIMVAMSRCWSGRRIEVRMALARPLVKWNALACSLV